ncbi:MAG: hypothetical protein ACYS74_17565, partial [Planctomycetota bacterium]
MSIQSVHYSKKQRITVEFGVGTAIDGTYPDLEFIFAPSQADSILRILLTQGSCREFPAHFLVLAADGYGAGAPAVYLATVVWAASNILMPPASSRRIRPFSGSIPMQW